MNQSIIGNARVTAGPAVNEVVHHALSSLGWTILGGGAGRDVQLEIVDLAAFRACSGSEREARFPLSDRRAGRRACVLVCQTDEYPDAPHDRFDAVVTTPVTAPRLLALMAALFPPREVAGSEP